MFGEFLFWIHYIITGILLYIIFKCSYSYVREDSDNWRINKYVLNKTRDKHPLWFIILFIIIGLIPVVNLAVILAYMTYTATNSDKDFKIYYKSFLTKEY